MPPDSLGIRVKSLKDALFRYARRIARQWGGGCMSTMGELLPLVKFIEDHPEVDVVGYLRKIVNWVKECPVKHADSPGTCDYGFEWSDVGVPGWLLKQLVEIGVLRVTLQTIKHTMYNLAVDLQKLDEFLSMFSTPSPAKVELPPDFLDVVEGYDDLKAVIKRIVVNEEPIHVLLVGPPSTAKSLMLMEIERLPSSVFITMGTATKAGIRDVLLARRPRYLIIDEIDKLRSPDDLSILLTLMESGRLVVSIHRVRVDVPMKVWVFAAANRIDRLPRELLDRFWVFNLRAYTKDEYVRIVTNILIKRYGKDPELARYIAEKVSEYSLSAREAIRYAKLCNDKQCVDQTHESLIKYLLRT
jgi:Holliday junction DNA helicase RuvB